VTPDTIIGTFHLYKVEYIKKRRKRIELLSIGPRMLKAGDTLSLDNVKVSIPVSVDDPELPGGDTFWIDGELCFTWELPK
jgi:hypothetical protein